MYRNTVETQIMSGFGGIANIILEGTAPEEVSEDPANVPQQPQIELKQQSVTTRSGRMIKKPMRYRDN